MASSGGDRLAMPAMLVISGGGDGSVKPSTVPRSSGGGSGKPTVAGGGGSSGKPVMLGMRHGIEIPEGYVSFSSPHRVLTCRLAI
jgi:hypothetical protein